MIPKLSKMIMLTLLGMISLVWGQTTTQNPKTPLDKTEEVLTRTLNALEQGLDFMQQNHQKINLDGVIGTRLVEGKAREDGEVRYEVLSGYDLRR